MSLDAAEQDSRPKAKKSVWKTLLYTVLLIIAAIISIPVGAHFYGEYEKRPKAITEYLDVKLGDSAEEVRYAKSAPVEVYDRNGKIISLPSPDQAKDFSTWFYPGVNQYGTSQIIFDRPGGKVEAILCQPLKVSSTRGCSPVNDIFPGSNEDFIKKRLGKPTSEKIEDQFKILAYPDYNLVFWLRQKNVFRIIVSKNAYYR